MTVPKVVREKYDRVLGAYRMATATSRAARAGQPGSAFETMVDSYQRLNEFFKYYIDHVSMIDRLSPISDEIRESKVNFISVIRNCHFPSTPESQGR